MTNNETTLAKKIKRALALLDLNREEFAQKANISVGTLARLIPTDGRCTGRIAELGTVLNMINASEGLLTIEDFQEHGLLDPKSHEFKNKCPLCGHALPVQGGDEIGSKLAPSHEERRKAA